MSSLTPVASSVRTTTSLPSTSSTMRPPLACRALAAEINARLVGSEQEILVEHESNGRWGGRTRGNKLVYLTDGAARKGESLRARITDATAWSMLGTRIVGS